MFEESKRKTIQVLAASTDLYNGDPESDYVDCKGLVGLKFILAQSAGATGTATITVEKDADGSGSGTAIAFYYRVITSAGVAGDITAAASTGYTTVAGAEKTIEIFVKLDELGSGFRYVRFVATEVVDSACSGMGLAELQPRTV